MRLRAGIGLLVWCTLACAVDISGQIQWNDICPNATSLGHARAILDEGTYNGGVTSDGNFVIPDVPDGTYILSIDSHDYSFDQYRIDVKQDSSVEVRPYILGVPMHPPADVFLPYPLSIVAKEKYVYFLPQQGFNLGGMLSSPMMIAMIACGALVLATPYIMKNLDPDVMERGTANAQGNFHSSVSPIRDETVKTSRVAPNSKAKSGSKKSKK